MDDTISRRAAIHIVLEYDRRLCEHVGTPKDNEMYSFGRGLLLSIERNLKQLPPAQPKIIPCKDCKYAEVADPEDSQDGYTCQFHRGSIWFSGSYCSWAERREEP